MYKSYMDDVPIFTFIFPWKNKMGYEMKYTECIQMSLFT
mgnify:CR=1 FL=1